MQRLYPGHVADPDDGQLLGFYAPPPGPEPFVRFNFVATADGAATHGGLSGALGSAGDKRVFSLLRRFADVILVGAGTIRSEGYGGELLDPASRDWRLARDMAERPLLAVVTGKLDLDEDSELFRLNPGEILILTSSAADPAKEASLARFAEVLRCPLPGSAVDPLWIREVLAGRGHRVIHSEGGPHLLGAFQAASAIDSLCLTTAPLMAGGGAGRISAGAPGSELHRLALHTLLEEDGNLLAEYRRVAETNGA
ncbi:pyrimidine reductase family protein [Paeniglutamicibacter sp. NPDC091659]|uniref:pyrimidine reductase family protein n=1 Tax=Paeniglutamicibacter sp. NPDC091659 TaxID=3364389 RepID=UPI003819759C